MVAQAHTARHDRLPLGNEEAARRLEKAAHTLEERGENPFRVRAYRVAADTVRRLARPAAEILQEGGRRALMELPGIGDRLSVTLEQLLLTGHMPQIEGLGDRPEDVIGSVAGVGPELARRIHDALHIETLADDYDLRADQIEDPFQVLLRRIGWRHGHELRGPQARADASDLRGDALRGQHEVHAPRRQRGERHPVELPDEVPVL